ncbi:uncharacterized protein EDB93DRAFT_1125407 [Suillus bovinus]|uniref:uncharacterized protein n=1 Tax=Suillus bovinus TaxID=48563 RepID=UPI001B87587B|nr:uncharacterized protein EDB93DRAFT_1125407 [Suillus bovinus]KAG2156753.1 hypothetical protein EDB93DRAFT_1125407 [Suillus bovinus]
MSAIRDGQCKLVRRLNSRPVRCQVITRPAACRRFSSTAPPQSSTTGGVRVSRLFTALLALGIGATSLGLYEFYTSFTLWPEQVRGDLRAGIKARNQGDLSLSERYITRAFQTALSLPYQTFAPDPYLKLSGIASLLSEVASERRSREALQIVWELGAGPSEQHSSLPDAEKTPNDAVEGAPGWSSYTLRKEERLRRVALAYKLGQLASERNMDEEEKWLIWAVEEVLKLSGLGITNADSDTNTKASALEDLELPTWMSKTDLGAPLEALGTLYAKKGRIEYAIPLYLQAISLLLPPKANNVSIEDRCRAAQLMNNLSELIMRRPPTPEVRAQAEAWAGQALGIIEQAQAQPRSSQWFGWGQAPDDGREVCEQALGVVLFNLGSLREMTCDLDGAKKLFEKSAEQCSKVGIREGVVEAQEALRRVEKMKKVA